jgi:NAD(P)-dependent dehydrogenase (short-subunit alcohol dehydrogenase family)
MRVFLWNKLDLLSKKQPHDHRKSVAVVTGASQGIGRATALLARNFSACCVLVARDALAKVFAEQGIKDRRTGQWLLARSGDGWTPVGFLRKTGAGAQSDGGRSDQEIPGPSRCHSLPKPEKIADLIGYLLSPAARWMAGAGVRMDGGEITGI